MIFWGIILVLRWSIVRRLIETHLIRPLLINFSVSDIGSATFDHFGTIQLKIMFLPVLKKNYDEKCLDCRAKEINCTLKIQSRKKFKCETIERRTISQRSTIIFETLRYCGKFSKFFFLILLSPHPTALPWYNIFSGC